MLLVLWESNQGCWILDQWTKRHCISETWCLKINFENNVALTMNKNAIPEI